MNTESTDTDLLPPKPSPLPLAGAAGLVAEAVRKEESVVVILGAGASSDAGIPTGEEVWSALSPEDRHIVDHELPKTNSPRKFFDVIDVLAKFRGEEQTQSRLTALLKPKHVSLGYEILAHYLHHGRLGAVVSLNLDQAFDASLELEATHFEREVRSRSEFARLLEEIRTDGTLPPAYLKVHGCVSRKMTFRIERRSIRQLESEKLGVLERYFERAKLILCIGWSMHDPDIFRPLSEHLGSTKQRRLVVVNRSMSEEFTSLVGGLKGQFCTSEASPFLEEVARQIEPTRSGSEGLPPVGLLRHSIRSYCFGVKGVLRHDEQTQAAIEVLMFALKARAQIEPRILFDCNRTAILLAREQERREKEQREREQRKKDDEPQQKLPPESAEERRTSRNRKQEGQVRVLADVLSSLREERILEGGPQSTYWLVRPDAGALEGGGQEDPQTLLERVAHRVADQLTRHDCKYLRSSLASGDLAAARRELAEEFAALTRTFDVDVIPRPGDFAIFLKPSVLGSRDELQDATTTLLKQLDPSKTLCLSTNSGEWFRRHLHSLAERIRRCQILVENQIGMSEENPFRKVVELQIQNVRRELEQAGVNTEVRMAKGKVHQLTAVFEENGTCAGAIYFRREGKSPRISPVLLGEPEDLRLIAEIWSDLWDPPGDEKRMVDHVCAGRANASAGRV